jgi:hypothetical protein
MVQRIYREGDTTILEGEADPYVADVEGVQCLNPEAAEAERKYRKVFRSKQIYFPEELDKALQDHLRGKYVVVLAMNGYSRLSAKQCAEWGVKPGAYEKACSVLLTEIFKQIRGSFPDADVRFTHGASDMGVDSAISKTALELRRPQLGFSCYDYLWYVKDDNLPVYVSPTVDLYSSTFVKECDILIAANGRLQAYRMDIAGVFDYDKFLIPVNVLRLISINGGPPAKNAEGKIEDAVAHFEQRVFTVGQHLTTLSGPDIWRSTVQECNSIVIRVCRQILDPEVGLEVR